MALLAAFFDFSPQFTPSATTNRALSFLAMTAKESAMGSPVIFPDIGCVSYKDCDTPKAFLFFEFQSILVIAAEGKLSFTSNKPISGPVQAANKFEDIFFNLESGISLGFFAHKMSDVAFFFLDHLNLKLDFEFGDSLKKIILY